MLSESINNMSWYGRLRGHYHRARKSQWFRRLCYHGQKFQCPICQSSLRCFIAHHSDPEKQYDSVCPVCFAKSPHRRIWLYLEAVTKDRDWGYTLVHLAPELSIQRRLTGRNFGYVTGDICTGRGQIKADICDLPFKDNSVDFLLACHILMMLRDDKQAVNEVYRVLRPGRYAILEAAQKPGKTITPDSVDAQKVLWVHSDVFRLYGEEDYRALLEGVGFHLIRHQFDGEKVKRCDLRQDWLYVAQKPGIE